MPSSPGAKFYKPLSSLVAAGSAGMSYTPVTRADLAKGYPTPGWNEPTKTAAAGSAAAAAAAAPAARRTQEVVVRAAPTSQPAAARTGIRSNSSSSGAAAVAVLHGCQTRMQTQRRGQGSYWLTPGQVC